MALLCAATRSPARPATMRHAAAARGAGHRPRRRRPVGARRRTTSSAASTAAGWRRPSSRPTRPTSARSKRSTTRSRSSCAASSRRRVTTRANADERRIGDLYESFMDEAAVERAGLAPLAGELAAIDALQSPAQLRRGHGPPDAARRRHAAAHVHRPGRARRAALRAADRPGRPRPARPRLLPRRRRRQVQGRARRATSPTSPACSSCRARRATRRRRRAPSSSLETALAQGQWTRVDNRDPVKTYNRVELAALAPLAPGFDWPAWLAGHRPRRQDRRRDRPAAELSRRPSPRSCRRRRCRSGRPTCAPTCSTRTRPYLAKDFVDARFAYVGTTLSGTTENLPRWKRGVALRRRRRRASRSASSTSTPTSRRRRRRAWKSWSPTCSPPTASSIDAIDWMGPATKQEAQAKLATFAPKIGYPKRWIDYATLETQQGRSRRQRPARARVRLRARPRQARQAGRSRRVVHDAADRQRLLQRLAQRDRLPGVGAAAAVLRSRRRRRRQLRRDRRDHRPRDQPRLRRRGQPVRRHRQPARRGGPTRTGKRFEAKTKDPGRRSTRRSRRSPATTSTAS